MKSERVAAIVLGFVMIFSLIGYALMNVVPDNNDNNQVQIPYIVTRLLENQEKIYILQRGRILIENFYSSDIDSLDFNTMLREFTEEFKDYIVLEIVKVEAENETILQMVAPDVGGRGKIISLNENITKADLFNTFCDVTIFQPQKCIMRDI